MQFEFNEIAGAWNLCPSLIHLDVVEHLLCDKKAHHFTRHPFVPFSHTFSFLFRLFPQLLIKTHTYYISTMNEHKKKHSSEIMRFSDSLPGKFRYFYGQCHSTATIPFEPIFSAVFFGSPFPFHSIRFHIVFIRSIGGFPHIMKFMNYW